ncbi:hypothetical protein QQF64_008196 [Cirrhinus molitorella]|uniref:Uncharacterized protein n=1 Tax=Cirrhinus molitorella TaxID=172907 RepID=A0ABR3M8V7_9TELE
MKRSIKTESRRVNQHQAAPHTDKTSDQRHSSCSLSSVDSVSDAAPRSERTRRDSKGLHSVMRRTVGVTDQHKTSAQTHHT